MRILALLASFLCAFAAAAQSIPLVPLTNVWKYQQGGVDLGTAWRQSNFDDSTWPAGAAALGYDENPAVAPLIQTSLRAETNGARIATYYLRTHFAVSSFNPDYLLSLSNLVDDGAVFYLNGTEILRVNMPTGPVNYDTRALVAVSTLREGILIQTNASAANLMPGDNVLAVELHQSDLDSTDIVFATALYSAPFSPLSFVSQPTNVAPAVGATATLEAKVRGSLPHYQWFKDGAALEGATNDALFLVLLGPGEAGYYQLVASNHLGAITSQTATVTVRLQPDLNRHPPTLLSAAPAPDAGGGVIVTFDQALNPASAQDLANYSIIRADTGATVLLQSAEVYGTDAVRLQSEHLTPGTNYILKVTKVQNENGVPVRPDSQVSIATSSLLLPLNAVWRYNDSGADLGTGWPETGFNDTAWAEGPALLYNDKNFTPPADTMGATLISVTNAAGESIVTHYFRHHFLLPAEPINARLDLRYVVDDGMVLYLNGVEQGRRDMSAGPVTATTRASSSANEGSLNLWTLNPQNLVGGDNVLAVEVHQFSLASPDRPDITFGAEVKLQAQAYANIPPQVLRQPEPVIVNERAAVTFTGEILAATALQWLRNGVPIPGATHSSLNLPMATGADHGANFSLMGSNQLGSITSRVARLTIAFDVEPPYLLGANMGTNDRAVTVVFSEPLDPATATNLNNYSIRDETGQPLTILAATYVQGSNVILATEPRTNGVHFTLSVDGVRDASDLRNSSHEQLPIGYEIVRIPWDGLWRYDDSGQDQGTAWRESVYDDSIWPIGPGLLGFEDVDQPLAEPLRTVLFPPNLRGPVYYFRNKSLFALSPDADALWLRYFIDDGAVFFINGVEFHRVAVPLEQNYHTLATRGGDAVLEGPFIIATGGFLSGTNVLAVEVHQTTANSDDSVFGLELTEAFDVRPLRAVRPHLRFGSVENQLVLRWDNLDYILEQAPALSGPWQPVPAPTIPYTVTPTGNATFYRLRR